MDVNHQSWSSTDQLAMRTTQVSWRGAGLKSSSSHLQWDWTVQGHYPELQSFSARSTFFTLLCFLFFFFLVVKSGSVMQKAVCSYFSFGTCILTGSSNIHKQRVCAIGFLVQMGVASTIWDLMKLDLLGLSKPLAKCHRFPPTGTICISEVSIKWHQLRVSLLPGR